MDRFLLSDEDIHAIMNQMEVPMSKTAAELADIIAEKKIRSEQRAYEGLKQKVVDATSRMIASSQFDEDIELTEEDLLALTKVTEALRELGYKFRFIEVQDSSGNTIKHKLLVSVAHLA